MSWNVYLSGEIHTDWRQRIVDGCGAANLPIVFTSAVTDHAASDASLVFNKNGGDEKLVAKVDPELRFSTEEDFKFEFQSEACHLFEFEIGARLSTSPFWLGNVPVQGLGFP